MPSHPLSRELSHGESLRNCSTKANQICLSAAGASHRPTVKNEVFTLTGCMTKAFLREEGGPRSGGRSPRDFEFVLSLLYRALPQSRQTVPAPSRREPLRRINDYVIENFYLQREPTPAANEKNDQAIVERKNVKHFVEDVAPYKCNRLFSSQPFDPATAKEKSRQNENAGKVLFALFYQFYLLYFIKRG